MSLEFADSFQTVRLGSRTIPAGESGRVRTQNRAGDRPPDFVENRRRPRYKLQVAIKIYARSQSVLRGDTVDISESGISAMLRDEVPLGEVVRLEFTLPSGEVEVLAVARQRNAFRFGFEFLEDAAAQELIRRACRELAIEEALFEKHDP
jgi:c-di-GMP-binding flagellar brake protein YcgR